MAYKPSYKSIKNTFSEVIKNNNYIVTFKTTNNSEVNDLVSGLNCISTPEGFIAPVKNVNYTQNELGFETMKIGNSYNLVFPIQKNNQTMISMTFFETGERKIRLLFLEWLKRMPKKRRTTSLKNMSKFALGVDIFLLDAIDSKKEIIWKGMEYLSEQEREIITLIDIEGLHYNEASKLLGTPVGTVRSRINRARTHLKDVILRWNFFKGELSNK
jgi:predicted DNA-binding protein (UPF0251 family)